MRRPFFLTTALLTVFSSMAAIAAPLRSIPGPDGGWDYASVDPGADRLYVARSTSVTVIDLSGSTPARSIGAIDHGHAVVPLPGDRLLVTSGHDGTVRLLDTRDGHELSRLAVGDDPDAALYDPTTRRAYVMVAKDGKVAVIDTSAFRLIATVPLKPALEFGALGADGTLYVNNEDANEIETIDTRTLKPGAPIALPGCEGPTGLAYDAASGELISACANGQAAIVDARARRLTALVAIGKGPDAVILDASHRRVFIPCGKSAELDVIPLDREAPAKVSERITTEMGARTGAIDPRSGMLYLPTAQFGPPPPAGGRPVAMAGSFHILAISPRQ
jgi:hypothetical protein